jgi:hypothetical protein
MSRIHRKKHQNAVIAVDQNLMPMNELNRHQAIKAVAKGKACVLDLSTWARLGAEGIREIRALQVIVFPGVKAVSDVKMGLGRGNHGILRRDGYRCQFEGCNARAQSIDHLTPRCQGGETSWRNCVAACLSCNQRKGGRTLEQAGMRLKRPPRSPRYALIERFNELAAAS